MKRCKKLFAAILSLCMIATMFVAVPVSAATENVIDINLALDDVSEITWVASNAVTVSNADGIGGRDKVIKAEGLANSNNNTVGIKLPDGFAFEESDVLTFSIDVYSDTVIHPDMWLRDHSDLAPFAQFGFPEIEVDAWTTITRTVKYEDMVTVSTDAGSTGDFDAAGNYKFYLRPRETAGVVYLDNLSLTVEREVIERGNVIDMEINSASDVTWVQPGVTVSDANGIGGRDNVVKMAGLSNSNNNTAGVKLPDGFAFCEGDILSYSFDIYAETAGTYNPDMWMRNHDSSLNPFATFYEQPVAGNTWVTVTQRFTYEQMNEKIGTSGSSGSFGTAGNYAFYLRPRSNITAYIDNFKVTVARVGYEAPEEVVRKNVVDVDVESASDITWTGSDAVVVSDANGIGGRDNVVKAEGLADSNNNTVGVKLGDNFAFCEGDILTFSVDVYSETAINPDMWLRNHTNLPTFVTFYQQPMAANTWTKITKTVTYADLVATGTTGWDEEGTYAFYLRPRGNATVYLDNFKVTVSRIDNGEPETPPVDPDEPIIPDEPEIGDDEDRGNVIDIEVNSASDITWCQPAVAVTDANGIGGRDNVVKMEGLANSNDNTAGVVLANSFAFCEGDILTYSFDIYSETAINPDIWVRNHGSSLTPFLTLYHEAIATNTWTTIEREVTYADLMAAGAFDSADKYALYIRPRSNATVYIDNFKVTVARVGYVPVEKENVVDFDLPLDAANELTWVASEAVVVTEADGIGGRDKVLKAEGLANSNNNTVGVRLPNGFAFDESDIITYSVDVYSETAITPDMWLRNHGTALTPFITFYHNPIAANTWTTLTKTVTYADLLANGDGWTNADEYAFYVRPRSDATVYLDNLKLTITREIPAEPDEPEEVYIPGDIDNNGEVNARDVISLRRFIAGGYDITVNEATVDVDRDNDINSRDVITLRRFIAGGYDIELK